MRRFMVTICLVLAVTGCEKEQAPLRPTADVVYANGRIWTGSPDLPWAESMAIQDGRIAAIGSTEEIEAWRGDDTVFHDLAGYFVSPGFQDSHLHIMYKPVNQVDLIGAATLEEVQSRIQSFARANPDRSWITGFGWNYAAFPDQQPLATHIDTVVSDRPVFIKARDGHMSLANSMAMEMASIDAETSDPENGRIVRFSDGTATGELQESAASLVEKLIPPPTPDERYQTLLANMQNAAAAGLTAFHEAGVLEENIPLFERAEGEGKLLQRVELALRMITAENRNIVPLDAVNSHIEQAVALRDRLNGQFLRARSIKGMLDGTIDATTAAMFDNFVGTDTAGIPFWEVDTLKEVVALYDKAGFQVILHAIGDRAISEALDAFEYANAENGSRDMRHRVEHAEMPRVADLERFRKMGVIASTQPMFAYPDATVLNNFAVLLGHERAQHADNFALWDTAGVRQVFGSDHPVMTLSVLKGIEAAASRMTESGNPPGGWYPEGRISVESALRHYTSDSAWGVDDDEDRGSLVVGKFADFVVLSENILEIDPTGISEVNVLKTVMHGRTTFEATPETIN